MYILVATGAFAGPADCEIVQRLLVGPSAQRERLFKADGGEVDVVVYWKRKSERAWKFLPVPGSCALFDARFHERLDDLKVGASGIKMFVEESDKFFTVMVQSTRLRPLPGDASALVTADTDVERISKK